MLYAAFKQDSATVGLDILTYSDLEILRGKKDTSTTSTITTKSASSNNNKRYLILTYNVEFDRITYPLNLNYRGVPDPVEMTKIVRKLKEQLKAMTSGSGDEYRNKEIRRLEEE